MKQHVPKLELCQRFSDVCKEKGIEVPEVQMYWTKTGEILFQPVLPNQYVECPAPLVSELAYWVAKNTDDKYQVFINDESAMTFHNYEPIMEIEGLKLTRIGYKLETISNAGLMAETLPECWMKLVIYLIEHGYVSSLSN